MKKFLFNTELDIGDTQKIKSVHKILQITILVIATLIALSSVGLLIYFFCAFSPRVYDEVLWIPFVIFAVDVVFLIFAKLIINIKFGYYYDLRTLRILKSSESNQNNN